MWSFLLVAALVQQGQKPGPIFQQVIPNPTGENGYEEFVMAAEMVTNSREFQMTQDVENGPITLKQKRAAVTANKKALDLLRFGLQKKSFQPRTEMTAATLLPEFAQFRNMARMLAMEQQVFLADGSLPLALDSLRDGLLFSHRFQSHILIGGLVGLACTSIIMRPISLHLEQLDYQHCNRLIEHVKTVLEEPSPELSLVEGEAKFADEELSDPKTLLENLPYLAGPEEVSLRKAAEAGPEYFEQEAGRARLIARDYFATIRAELGKSIWERNIPAMSAAENDPLANQIAAMFLPAFTVAFSRFAESDARVRLLATHAGILAHRWWFGELPSSLDVLKLGDLAIDPFSGKPFVYKPSGWNYKLYSVGADKTDNDGNDDLFLTREGIR